MVPFSASDIVKLLEQIPIWKAIAGLPKRLADLERRIADLEQKAGNAPRRPDPLACPICGDTMTVRAERPHPDFGFAGDKVHTTECAACGNKAERHFSPGKGYQ